MNLNPCDYVKKSCEKVLAHASHVTINAPALVSLADSLKSTKDITTYSSWAECHFPPQNFPLETVLRYVFVIDTLNFCFWPNPPFEYDDLAKNLYDTLKVNPSFFDMENLAHTSPEKLKEAVFKTDFCLLEERARMIREVFTVLLKSFKGSCTEFVKSANNSAPGLVKLIVDSFPCFRDQAIYKGCQVFLYKRTQILVSDLHLAYKDLLSTKSAKPGDEVLNFGNTVKELTTFADYRVPQVLRAKGVLTYSKELANLIDNNGEIMHSSEYEVEIRAGTVIAVEKLKDLLEKIGIPVMSLEVDVCLWQIGEKIKAVVQPHHRTLSIFY